MADLFSVTAPLAIRFADGSRNIMVERIPWRDGVAFLPPFWTRNTIEQALCLVPGPITGDGPWKAGDAVITVLGCHGTDGALAQEFSCWQSEIAQMEGYPERATIRQLMERQLRQAATRVGD